MLSGMNLGCALICHGVRITAHNERRGLCAESPRRCADWRPLCAARSGYSIAQQRAMAGLLKVLIRCQGVREATVLHYHK